MRAARYSPTDLADDERKVGCPDGHGQGRPDRAPGRPVGVPSRPWPNNRSFVAGRQNGLLSGPTGPLRRTWWRLPQLARVMPAG